MTVPSLDELMHSLRAAMRSNNLSDEDYKAMQAVRDALKADGEAALHRHTEQLRAWGMLPADTPIAHPEPTDLAPEPATDTDAAQPEPPAVEPGLNDAVAFQAPVTLPIAELPASPGKADEKGWIDPKTSESPPLINQPAEPFLYEAEAPAEEDANTALQPAIEQILKQMKHNEYRAALAQIEVLYPQARGSELKDSLLQWQQQAQDGLQTQVREAVRAAEALQQQKPDDLPALQTAWQAVLNLDPQQPQALQQVTRDLPDHENKRKYRRQLEQLSAELAVLEAPNTTDPLPRLNTLLSTCDALAREVQDAFFELGLRQSMASETLRLKSQVEQARNTWRDKLGMMSTLAAGGQWKPAYNAALQAQRVGHSVLVDTGNLLGRGPGTEVPIGDALPKFREGLLAFLRGKAAERQKSAEPLYDSRPDVALEYLKEALDFLTDPVLTIDDKASLEADRVEIEKAYNLVEKNLKRYHAARDKVLQAEASAAAETMRRLVIEARAEYANYPGLEELEARALNLLATEQATYLENALSQAITQALQRQYDSALQTLQTARQQVYSKVPQPVPGSRLQTLLAQLNQEEASIRQAGQTYADILKRVGEIKKHIQNYRASNDPTELSTARSLYDVFNEAARKITEVELIGDELRSLQNDQTNWDDAQRAYNEQRWHDAEQSFANIKNTFAEYNQAQTLKNRAHAAHLAETAQTHYENEAWQKALRMFRQALNLFDGLRDPQNPEQILQSAVGFDALTEPLRNQCITGLEALRVIEENDAAIKPDLDKAKQQISVAEQQVKQRKTLLDQLDPLPGLKNAVHILQNLQIESFQTSLGDEITSQLSKARALWLRVYAAEPQDGALSPLENAARQQDFGLLIRARERAEELRAASLLTETHTYYALLDAYLEAEYTALQHPWQALPAVSDNAKQAKWFLLAQQTDPQRIQWELVELNRRAAVDLSKQRRGKTEEEASQIVAHSKIVEEQYREAARERIRGEIQSQTPQEQQQRLQLALAAPFLKDDQQLVEWLLEACWKQADWSGAESALNAYARNLQRSTEFRAVWGAFTQAMQYYQNNQVEMARAELSRLKKREDLTAEDRQQIEARRTQIEKDLLQQFIQTAQAIESKSSSEDELLRVAEIYAKARNINQEDVVVNTALRNLGDRLAPGINNLCKKADTLTIGKRQLTEAIKQVEGIFNTLENLSKVAEMMEFSEEDVRERLANAYQNTRAKLESWKRALMLLNDFDAAFKKAKASPARSDGSNLTGGGWHFDDVQAILDDLGREVVNRKEADLRALYEDRLQRLDEANRTATNLWQPIAKLLEALSHEEFKQIMTLSQRVDESWAQARRADPDWDGLNGLLQYINMDGRVITNPSAHRRWAESQEQNFSLWQAWVAQTEKLGKEVAQKASKFLRPPLEQLVEDNSLRELEKICTDGIRQCDEYLEKVAQPPEQEPLSKRAQYEQQKIAAGRQAEIENYRTQFQSLRTRVGQEMKKLNQVMIQLRSQMQNVQNLRLKAKGKPIAPQAIEMAKNLLKQVREIDPCNEDLSTMEKQLGKN